MRNFLLFSLLCFVGVNAHAQFDQIFRGQNVGSPITTIIPAPGPHAAYCGLRVGILNTTIGSPILTYGYKHNINLGTVSNASAVTYCLNNGLYQDPTLKANLMAESSIYFPDVCGKTFVAYNSAASGQTGYKPFGWSHGGTRIFTWESRPCKISPADACKAKAPAGHLNFGVFTDTTAQCCTADPKSAEKFCCVNVQR